MVIPLVRTYAKTDPTALHCLSVLFCTDNAPLIEQFCLSPISNNYGLSDAFLLAYT